MKLIPLTLIEKECNFLNACGFSTSRGYTSDDVEYYRKKEPDLYYRYVTNW